MALYLQPLTCIILVIIIQSIIQSSINLLKSSTIEKLNDKKAVVNSRKNKEFLDRISILCMRITINLGALARG